MQKINSYIITWRPDENVGQLHLHLENGKGADLPIDNPEEATFLLMLLRHEPNTRFDPENRLLSTGVDVPGDHHSESEASRK